MRNAARFSYGFTHKKTPQDTTGSLFPQLSVDEAVKGVERDALFFDLYLPDEYVGDILTYTKTHSCLANASLYPAKNKGEKHLFYYSDHERAQQQSGKAIVKGVYENPASSCAAIAKIQNDPKLLNIAARYLNGDPRSNTSYLWWSFATQATTEERLKAKQTVLYHYDLIGYRFIYFNFYITDVDQTAGPHVAVKGSHTRKKFTHLLGSANQSDERIRRVYGEKDIVTICGKSGYGFIQDSFCYHKALAPTHNNRLLLQVRMT